MIDEFLVSIRLRLRETDLWLCEKPTMHRLDARGLFKLRIKN